MHNLHYYFSQGKYEVTEFMFYVVFHELNFVEVQIFSSVQCYENNSNDYSEVLSYSFKYLDSFLKKLASQNYIINFPRIYAYNKNIYVYETCESLVKRHQKFNFISKILVHSQPTFTFSKSTIKTPWQCVKSIES